MDAVPGSTPDSTPDSTIAALCYKRETNVDFRQLAIDLSKAAWDTQGGARLDMPTPDFALCDTPDMRIGLAQVALDHTFPGSLTGRHYPVCMVLSVGPGETVPNAPHDAAPNAPHDAPHDAPPKLPMEARFARVRADLVSRVQDIAAADRILMFERAGPYDTELHDTVVDDIRGHLDKVLSARREPVSDIVQPVPALRPAGTVAAAAQIRAVEATQPEDIIQGLARRLEVELDRLEETRRALEQVGATPERRQHRPQAMRQVVPRLFTGLPTATSGLFRMPAKPATKDETYPDYEHMPANVDERPLLHRAAVNALNATVMTIALPVGAALLTMAVLGREDLLFSSRVTAVTGVGVGLHNTGLAERLFALIS